MILQEDNTMPIIRPSSDLRNKYTEISSYCHDHDEPIFLTKNGAGDLAVMSIGTYERLVGIAELKMHLVRGLRDAEAGRVRDAEEVLAEIESEMATW
jgi:PHD/YefM family antitoxin component YafN of YafNO toxin-antitoxin module